MLNKILIDSFSKHIHLDINEEEIIEQHLVYKKIKKRQYFLHEHQTAQNSAFVISGCLRSYSIDENGSEHILQFAPEKWWITDMHSFISQGASRLNIDALLDSEIYILSREHQNKLFDLVPKLERYFRIITEKALVSSRQRVLDTLELTAKERYTKFCNVYPGLINSIPQKLIASYIGVTPEFLSKLRAEQF
ncbi:Crp/Fnr family transcriptional regulator [Candidatus Kapaibacterium sp.]